MRAGCRRATGKFHERAADGVPANGRVRPIACSAAPGALGATRPRVGAPPDPGQSRPQRGLSVDGTRSTTSEGRRRARQQRGPRACSGPVRRCPRWLAPSPRPLRSPALRLSHPGPSALGARRLAEPTGGGTHGPLDHTSRQRRAGARGIPPRTHRPRPHPFRSVRPLRYPHGSPRPHQLAPRHRPGLERAS